MTSFDAESSQSATFRYWASTRNPPSLNPLPATRRSIDPNTIPRLYRHRPRGVEAVARDGKVAERHYQLRRDRRKGVLGAYQRSDAEMAGPLENPRVPLNACCSSLQRICVHMPNRGLRNRNRTGPPCFGYTLKRD